MIVWPQTLVVFSSTLPAPKTAPAGDVSRYAPAALGTKATTFPPSGFTSRFISFKNGTRNSGGTTPPLNTSTKTASYVPCSFGCSRAYLRASPVAATAPSGRVTPRCVWPTASVRGSTSTDATRMPALPLCAKEAARHPAPPPSTKQDAASPADGSAATSTILRRYSGQRMVRSATHGALGSASTHLTTDWSTTSIDSDGPLSMLLCLFASVSTRLVFFLPRPS
mmetsp:Transcript_46657/g.143879  ORF Transcript_46657/g.143879 Transcript_46657/m.143879 type:complete len:224 (-) Transcript_46657:465-1136(-)